MAEKVPITPVWQPEIVSQEEDYRLAYDLTKHTGYLAAAETYHNHTPYFYDKNHLWWQWDLQNNIWVEVDEVTMLNGIRKVITSMTDSTVRRSQELLKAFKQIGRDREPEKISKNWVQFGNTQYNIKTNEKRQSSPKYFSTNNIPWNIGETEETPRIEELFTQWVGEEYKDTLLELLAYCCYQAYPLNLIFAFTGSGRNGKSQFLKTLAKFIGEKNVASTQLKLLTNNNFESFNLYRKLVAVMGETDMNLLNSTDMIKRLSGGDLIRYEKKGKTGFSDYNYAKLVIATNSLPSSDDSSEGYYRRWLVVDFPNEFPEGEEVYETIKPQEYENLATKILRILPSLLKKRSFTKQGTIQERQERYIAASNPLLTFIEKYCYTDDPDAYIRYSDLYHRYSKWLKKHKKRGVKKGVFTRTLEDEHEIKKTTITKDDGSYDKDRFVFGVKWRETIFEFDEYKASSLLTPVTHPFQVQSPIEGVKSERLRNSRNPVTSSEKEELDYSKTAEEDIF